MNNKLKTLYTIPIEDIISLEQEFSYLEFIGGIYHIIETSIKLVTSYSPAIEELVLDDLYDIYIGFGKQNVTYSQCILEYQEVLKKIRSKIINYLGPNLYKYKFYYWLDQTTIVLEEKENLELLAYDRSFDKNIMFDEDDYRNKEYTSTYVY